VQVICHYGRVFFPGLAELLRAIVILPGKRTRQCEAAARRGRATIFSHTSLDKVLVFAVVVAVIVLLGTLLVPFAPPED